MVMRKKMQMKMKGYKAFTLSLHVDEILSHMFGCVFAEVVAWTEKS